MPIHDWTRVSAGIFHAFHHDWITDLSRALNSGILPADYYALPEQIAAGLGPDVLTLRHPETTEDAPKGSGGVLLAETPPKVAMHITSEASVYAAKAKAVVVRHASNHHVVAMVEIVSPGNKSSRRSLDAFVKKANESLVSGVHLLIVDLFPPGPRDPEGIHPEIWDDDSDGFTFDDAKPLCCVSYLGSPSADAFIQPVAVDDPLPEMPLFLTPDVYVSVALEPTYESAWRTMPEYWRNVLTNGE